MTTVDLALGDVAATERAGARLARALGVRGAVVALQGELGAGKTTFVRALLRAMGVLGAIRSPTYTLVEPYQVGERRVFHLDLYRLSDPEELEYLGVRDLDEADALLLVEWPERARAALPPVDLWLQLDYRPAGRHLTMQSLSPCGDAILLSFQNDTREAAG